LLEDFNEKLWEKEEELRETTQHVEILQKNLERKNCVIVELVEHVRKLEDKNEDLDNKYYAEDYASHIKICGLRATHEAELANLKGKHSTQLCKIREKHAQETSQKDQCCLQLHKDLQHLRPHAKFCAPLAEQATGSLNYFTERKINELEEQVRLLKQEAERSEDRFVSMEASYLLKIEQIQEELDNVQLVPSQKLLLELQDVAEDFEEENEQLHQRVNWLRHVEAQNENLQAILEQYEEQQHEMQEQLEQVTKGATSQEKEELEILPEATQQERREQDPSSCKNELAELRHVRPAPRKQTIDNETHEEYEEAFENDSIEKVVVARKAKRRVNFFKRIFTSRK
ncbi:golgin subfamily A member 6-like protein 26, partial [Leucoraja erinacea]|uniref:golgin subfamily A member 6-like protein 26 n=1 Tax=Leucoraja erinaceus TaxID=7782 RepID=UPI0024541553